MIKHLPTEKILVNTDTGKRVGVVCIDGEAYVPIYDVILLMGIYRGWAVKFRVERSNLIHVVNDPNRRGPGVSCIKVSDVGRVEAFVADQKARRGLTATPLCAGNTNT